MSAAGDRAWRATTAACAAVIPVLLGGIGIVLLVQAAPALRSAGLGLVSAADWAPGTGRFGALAALIGTIATSLLAVAFAGPIGVGAAVFTAEIAPRWLARPVAALTDLLAAIPSVVYGLWGVAVLLPLLRESVYPALQSVAGDWPLFSGATYGPSVLAAGVLLGIMILPYVTAISREVLSAVPRSQREAALALGATRWEMLRDAVLPSARTGILGGLVLALGRALGETMAVAMVIGNRHDATPSLLQPGYTMASLLANEFGEAAGDLHLSALMAVALLLLVLTLVVNAVARALVRRVTAGGFAAVIGA